MNYYDLPEKIWQQLKEILPMEGSVKGGRPAGAVQNFFNALHWMLKTGAPWRALPSEYGSWKTIYSRYRRWEKRGYFSAMLTLLCTGSDMEYVMIDGSYIHAHKHSAGAKGGQDKQSLGRSRGGFTTKIHAVVDALGYPISFHLTGGQVHDVKEAFSLLEECHAGAVLADKGYDSNRLIEHLEKQGCKAVIPPRKSKLKPRTIDYHHYKERHLVENFFCKIKEFRRIATRYDKLESAFAGFICIVAILIWLK